MSTTTAIIPRHHVAPLWESFHGLAGISTMRQTGGVVIEPIPMGMVWRYRVTSGLALEIAG